LSGSNLLWAGGNLVISPPYTTEFRNLLGLLPVYRFGVDCRTADTAVEHNEQAKQMADPLNIPMMDNSLTTKNKNFQKRSISLASIFIILPNTIPNTQQTYKTIIVVLWYRLKLSFSTEGKNADSRCLKEKKVIKKYVIIWEKCSKQKTTVHCRAS